MPDRATFERSLGLLAPTGFKLVFGEFTKHEDETFLTLDLLSPVLNMNLTLDSYNGKYEFTLEVLTLCCKESPRYRHYQELTTCPKCGLDLPVLHTYLVEGPDTEHSIAWTVDPIEEWLSWANPDGEALTLSLLASEIRDEVLDFMKCLLPAARSSESDGPNHG